MPDPIVATAPAPAAITPAPAPAPAPGATSWPTDWRERLSGGDDKKLTTLQRYQSPEAYNDGYFSLRQKLSSGELKAVTPFPDKGSPEEQTIWRKENGIPETSDKYDLTFDDGLVIGEDDKPIIDHFLKSFHAANASPSVVKSAIKAYYAMVDDQAAKAAEATKTQKKETEDSLREAWGSDYRGNRNAIENLIHANVRGESQELKTRILNGIDTSAEFAQFMAAVALQLNPQGTLTGAAGGDRLDNVSERIKQIEEVMRNDRKKYNRDQGLQQELRDLYQARDRLNPPKKQA